MLPAVNKTFSPVDHMIPSIKRCTWENSGQTYGNNTAVAHAPGITALLNFDTSHEGNAGEKNRGEKGKCYRAVLTQQSHADSAEQSNDNAASVRLFPLMFVCTTAMSQMRGVNLS